MAKDDQKILDIVQRIYARVAEIGEKQLGTEERFIDALNTWSKVMALLDDIKREVREQKEVVQSVVLFAQGVRDEIARLKNVAVSTEADPQLIADLNTLALEIDQNTATIANAVASNTAAAPVETPAVQEPPVIPADPQETAPEDGSPTDASPAPSEVPPAEPIVQDGQPVEPTAPSTDGQ